MKKILILFFAISAFALLFSSCKQKEPESIGSTVPVTLKVGHVGHDHQIALYVACDYSNEFSAAGFTLKTIQDQKFYELCENGQKIADIEIITVGGGAKMPAALAQGIIDIGIGGVSAVLSFADSGAPVKLISPLHSKGDMFVVQPDSPINTWDDFVKQAKTTRTPIRIGYKSPGAIAKIIFEDTLRHEGITFSQDVQQSDVQIHMINTNGGGRLNTSLSGDLVDGYVGNNPFCAIAVEKNIGKIVCDLEDLPPGNFKNHPCCCIAANTTILDEKAEVIEAILVLCLQATEVINADIDKAVSAATRWIGTSEEVERMSIPTSGYSMEQDAQWQATMDKWIIALNELGIFTGKLKGLAPGKACEIAYDMSLLDKARKKLENE